MESPFAAREPLAWINGRYLPADQARIDVTDAGFVLGVAVSEQLRTSAGRLFLWDAHRARLAESLAAVGLDQALAGDALGEAAERLALHHLGLLETGDDVGLTVFITPGPYATYAAANPEEAGPTVGLHTYALPFRLWAEKYAKGQSLVVSAVRQVPAACWPRQAKVRSRLHYWLADEEARRREPGSRAVLLDERGCVSETATANVVVYHAAEGLVSPPRADILPGITLGVVRQLAGELGLAWVERPVEPAELSAAGEVLLTSTPYGVLPVTRVDGRPVGRGAPGDVYRALLAALGRRMGVDLAEQARRFATR